MALNAARTSIKPQQELLHCNVIPFSSGLRLCSNNQVKNFKSQILVQYIEPNGVSCIQTNAK